MTRLCKGRPRGGLVALLLSLGLVSCAYYNTFFVAKKSFRAAEQSVAQNTGPSLPSDARRSYQSAVVQCRKVLENHPGSRWTDDAVYLMAASYYGLGEYDSAQIRLDQLGAQHPDSPFRAEALFLGGLTRTKLHDSEGAKRLFDQVVAEYPDFGRRDEILFVLGETAQGLRQKRSAIGYYDEITTRYPKSPRHEEALQKVGEIHFEEGRYDSASLYFDRLLSTVRDQQKEIDAAILQAQCLSRLDRAEEAIALLARVEPPEESVGQVQGQTRPARSTALADEIARIRMQRAAVLNRLERHGEAIETLRNVTERFSASSYAVEAQFQIGYTYETLLDSLEAARAAYDKATQMQGRSVFKDQARQRSTALKSIAELQEQVGSGDAALEARAEAALRIAEILYLDRNLLSEASVKYREIEREFPDSRAAPRAAYALAYIQWREQGDTVGALAAFRDLVGRYPASIQARSSIDLLAWQNADTSGLRELLVTPAPDTIPALADSLVRPAAPDTVPASDLPREPADSLSGLEAPPDHSPPPVPRGTDGEPGRRDP